MKLNGTNLVCIIRDAVLRNGIRTATAKNEETPEEEIRRAESACTKLLERIKDADLREAIDCAYGEHLAAYEDYGFQRGIQAGAHLILELLGEGPYKEG